MIDKFSDIDGKKSMMRTVTYMIVVTALVWGSAEIVYSFFNNDFIIIGIFITFKLWLIKYHAPIRSRRKIYRKFIKTFRGNVI